MAHPINTTTVWADHGTSYNTILYRRLWHILKIPLLYRQNMAHPINTATVWADHGTSYNTITV